MVLLGMDSERKDLTKHRSSLDRSSVSQDLEQGIRVPDRALATLNAVAAVASMALDVDEVLRQALALALEVVGVEAGAILVLDETTNELVFRVQQGWRGRNFVTQGARVPADLGLSGLVVGTGQPVMTGDVSHDPRVAVPEFRDGGVRAMALAPMRARGRVLGVLGVMGCAPYEFSAEEIMLISAIADQIGVALDNARLSGEARSRMQELATLQATSMQVAATFDLWVALEAIASSILDLTGAAVVEVHLYEGENDKLSFAMALRRDGERAPVGGRPPDNGPIARAARGGEVLVLEDLTVSQLSADRWQAHGVQALVALPLKRATCTLAVLAVAFCVPHSFSQYEMLVLNVLADQAAIAVERTHLFGSETHRSTQLALVNQVARQATATLNLNEILDTAASAIRRSFAYFNVALFLIDRAASETVLRSIAGGHAMIIRRGYRQAIGKGIVGWVAETGQTLLANDVTQEPRYRSILPIGRPVGAELAVPIVRLDEVIGVLDVQNLERGAFDQEDVRAMEALADQLAIAIDNARLYEETQQRLAEVSTLYQLAQQVNTSLDIQEVLDSIVWSLKQAMGCRGCSIALIDQVGNVLEIHAAAGIEDKWRRGFKLRLGEGVAGRVALDGTPMYVPDVLELDDFVFFDPSVRSLLTVPLSVQQKVIGTLTVDSERPSAFSAADERLITIAATQAAIAIENARLYANLERRARSLADAYAELREADQLKDEIVQNVSHELRTPLTFVKGYVELLLAGDMGPLTDEQREYLAIVAEKTDAVTQLVSDIIFLQRADRVPGKKLPISLDKLVRRALRGCAATAQESGLTLVANLPDDLPQVAGDERRLLQVFDNLLGNAIKFSPDGGQIVVTVEDVGSMVRASVSDQGIGIPEDERKLIFESFYRVDGSARRNFSGSGLGLAIAERIVEGHDGQIWVESEPGRGSTFYFTIPKYQDRKA